jgi:hypothetical protein
VGVGSGGGGTAGVWTSHTRTSGAGRPHPCLALTRHPRTTLTQITDSLTLSEGPEKTSKSCERDRFWARMRVLLLCMSLVEATEVRAPLPRRRLRSL